MENEEKLDSIYYELKPIASDFLVKLFDDVSKHEINDSEKCDMIASLLNYVVKSFVVGTVKPDNIEEFLEDFTDSIHAQIILEQGGEMISLEEMKEKNGLN